MGYFSQDFTTIEENYGMERGAIPGQYAKLKFEEVSFEINQNGNPEFSFRGRCDEKFALTPKSGFFWRFYPNGKMQARLDGITKVAFGQRTNKRFGAPAGDKDVREEYTAEEKLAAGKAVALMLTEKEVIGRIGVEVDPTGQYSDKNTLDEVHELNEANLAVIQQGGFDVKRIEYKRKKQPDGSTQKFLAVKGVSGAVARPSGGAPGTIA